MIWIIGAVSAYYVISVCHFLSIMGEKSRPDRWYDYILLAPSFSLILVLWLPLRWSEVRNGDTTWRCIFGSHDIKKLTVHHREGEMVWIRCPGCGHQEIIERTNAKSS